VGGSHSLDASDIRATENSCGIAFFDHPPP
jgi:hypothetical protein